MFEYPKSGLYNLRVSYQTNYYHPPVDVVESRNDFLVRIEIAGVDEKDISVNFEKNHLYINGVRNNPYKNHSFHQMEIHFGEFHVEIYIPQPVNSNSIKAEYMNGFLEITLPKAVPQDISVKNKDA